jgi:hypothetical protein
LAWWKLKVESYIISKKQNCDYNLWPLQCAFTDHQYHLINSGFANNDSTWTYILPFNTFISYPNYFLLLIKFDKITSLMLCWRMLVILPTFEGKKHAQVLYKFKTISTKIQLNQYRHQHIIIDIWSRNSLMLLLILDCYKKIKIMSFNIQKPFLISK